MTKIIGKTGFLPIGFLRVFLDNINNIMKQFAAIDKPATINIIPDASSAFSWHSTIVPFVALPP